MRVFTVARGMLRMSAASSTELEETDILAGLGAYGCDIALSSVFS